MRASVGLVRGEHRYGNVAQALNLVAEQVAFQGRQRVVVKPNFVSTRHQPAATHVDAVRAVLDFVRARYEGPLSIAEGAALGDTWQGFERFGYRELVKRYDVKLVDLNADQTIPAQVYDRRLKPKTLRLARTLVESDLRISVGPPKTHDVVIVTLSLKNVIMGALVNPVLLTRPGTHRWVAKARRLLRLAWFRQQSRWRLLERLPVLLLDKSDKVSMHQGYPVMNLNLALLGPWVYPHLAVIDGFRAMEGAGPTGGEPVDWRVALAGVDALAVDSLTAWLMGFDPAQIGYLSYCRRLGLGVGELERIDVLGDVDPETVRCSFRPHPTFEQQRAWHLKDVERWLRPKGGQT
jgi:uncharacterized protein (DUF362 family)